MSEDSDQEVVLPTVLSNLSNVIDSDLHNFVSGSTDIQSAALDATKFLFDLGESIHVVAVSLVVDPESLVSLWLKFLSSLQPWSQNLPLVLIYPNSCPR